jgi:hypothetical protein
MEQGGMLMLPLVLLDEPKLEINQYVLASTDG